MTDTSETTSPGHPTPETPHAVHHLRSRMMMIGGTALGVMALINLSLWWVLVQTAEPPPEVAAMGQKITVLDSRIARVEQRPVPSDIAPLLARIEALEKRPAESVSALTAPATPQPDPKLLDRLTALEALQTRLATLEQRPTVDPQVAGRMDALSGRADALASKSQSAETELTRRLEAADARIAKVEGATGQATTLALKAARLARLQSAESALAAGQPLGEIAGAPPALIRFALARPPTEAELKLAFPRMEKAVRAASHPDTEGKALLDRMWDRAQGLVTVRQGDNVLLGDNVAGVLSRARLALDAGDISGSVAALAALSGDPAKAAAPWIGDAKALLEARAALADLAAKS